MGDKLCKANSQFYLKLTISFTKLSLIILLLWDSILISSFKLLFISYSLDNIISIFFTFELYSHFSS